MTIQQIALCSYIDRGLFIRHDRTRGRGELFTRGFNSIAERDAYMTQHAALNPSIVAPGDSEDPRALNGEA